jgi:hypothetical protein
MKTMASQYYLPTRDALLNRIINGQLVHADETRANIKGKLAYVWVLTNLHEVVYILAETRDGALVQNLLANFGGVLISDFYSVYESISCPQQNCLIHLMRDLNDEVLKNAFDEELKSIVSDFSNVLQPIIVDIDKRGLKTYFLKKHLKRVDGFYRMLDQASFKSEVALSVQRRLEKNRNKLFTFLLYDGIPWNNNNAEHAIKAFAKKSERCIWVFNKEGHRGIPYSSQYMSELYIPGYRLSEFCAIRRERYRGLRVKA